MTNAPAAIDGVFADFRTIKTRSTAQIVIEVPIERADAALTALGGIPQPGQEKPVAVARLMPEAAGKPTAEPDKVRKPSPTPNAQRAAILNSEPSFRRFLAETSDCKGIAVFDTEMAKDEVRERCGVTSRAELDRNAEAAKRWHDLHADYQLWLKGVAA